MPSVPTINTDSIPEWQSQTTVLDARRNRNTLETPSSPGMLGKLKGTLRRKSSARSNSSRTSNEEPEDERRRSFRGPTELTAAVAELGISEPSSRVERNVMANLSPPTRRPDRPGMNAFTVPSNEPPPAYSPSPTSATGPTLGPSPQYSPASSVRAVSPAPSDRSAVPEVEDPYTFLNTFDTLLLIDDSGSMAGRSWRETSQALTQLLPIIVSHDHDGIDIFFLNHVSSDLGSAKDGVAAGGYRNVKTVEEVHRIFRTVKPGGGTPTGTRCRKILKPYISLLEAQQKLGRMDDVKPLNVLAITDGVPSDDVESVLLEAATKLDKLEAAPHQVGIQFFQVGNEEGAKAALKELDDGLVDLVQGGVRDMVDTCTWMGGNTNGEDAAQGPRLSAEGMLKVVLGAVVKRLDRRRSSGEVRR